MDKRSTTRKPRPAGPDLRGLLEAGGLRPIDLASKARVSGATVYKAMRGERVSNLQAWAMASALGVTEVALVAAIDRSKGAA